MAALSDKEYAQDNLGLGCPNCGDTAIEGMDSVEVQMGCASQLVRCRQCQATWDDHYTLTGYVFKDPAFHKGCDLDQVEKDAEEEE